MSKIELVMVPTPGMGHLPAAVKLAKAILQQHDRVSILVLIMTLSDDNAVLNSYIKSQSAYDPARLALVTLARPDNLPDGSGPNFMNTAVGLHRPVVKQAILDRVGSGSPRPAGFILDMFNTQMMDVAEELGVPSYIFYPSGASSLSLFFRLQSLVDDEGVDIIQEFGDNPNRDTDVPGFSNRVPGKVMPAIFFQKEGGARNILNHIRRFRQSKGILVNSFSELEADIFGALWDQVGAHELPPVYPVGPILELDSKTQNGSHQGEYDDIMGWLDQQPRSSVVFLCFGSMGSFDEVQVKEIAHGLERTGHRFLWSLRKHVKSGMPSQHEPFLEALPEGFLERTKSRGKIIAWAPQAAVLAHPAIGGFVSHCGWNSTLESIWFGVPMATWPIYAEQQLNAFALVKELGLAVEIRMDYRVEFGKMQANFVVTAKEIENGVNKLMSMDEETKGKVREMSDKARKALQDRGSSHLWLSRFVKDILNNIE